MSASSTQDDFKRLNAFRDGCGLPGWILFVNFLSLGAVLPAEGFTILQGLLSTLLVFALPAQIVVVDGIKTGMSLAGIAILVFLINARLFPMALSTAAVLNRSSHRPLRYYLSAHFIAVTGWLHLINRQFSIKTEHTLDYFLYFNFALILFSLWGTLIGFYAVNYIPYSIFVSLLLINPLYFLCVTAMAARDSLAISTAVIGGGLFYLPLSALSSDWALLLAGLAGGSVAALIDWNKRR